MSFILKNNPIVINTKLTSKGREMLAQGKLHFKNWVIGDSEIDYNFFQKNEINIFNAIILKAKHKNPNLISTIRRDQNSDSGNTLPTVVSYSTVINNTADPRGFFDFSTGTSEFKIKNASVYIKQPDAQIYISGVTGGTIIKINKSSMYSGNTTEPIVGDYLLVKWANPLLTGGTVFFDIGNAVPMLWYKIQEKISGSLSTNNLVVRLDRNTPDFNGQGNNIGSGCYIYPNSNNRLISGDSIQNFYGNPIVYNFNGIDDINTFFENDNIPTVDVPIWNMSLIYTEEIAGIDLNLHRNKSQYYSKSYSGFINYIERISPFKKNIGIIHYTNNSPSNNYGEGFYNNTSLLEIPTLLWHNNTKATIGLILSASTDIKILNDLSTTYHDLVDKYGNVVGKVFNDLKIFVIEDEELLFSMSYKSNRNWTLPPITLSFNETICDDPICSLIINSVSVTGETTSGSNDGVIKINASLNSGKMMYSINGGLNYKISNIFTGLSAGVYNISVIDTGSSNCVSTTSVELITLS